MFLAPVHEVQRPSHPRLHVRDSQDAHMIFEAVRAGKLTAVARRLNDAERGMFIRSGSVFVWTESDDDLGLRRWTDGLLWSASRMREPFLFYESRSRTPGSPSEGKTGLVKQTYSALVTLPDPSNPQKPMRTRKWHLTAYFDHEDFLVLPTIDHDPRLRNIRVPAGVYRSGRSRQSARHQPVVDSTFGWRGDDQSSEVWEYGSSDDASDRSSGRTDSRPWTDNDSLGGPSLRPSRISTPLNGSPQTVHQRIPSSVAPGTFIHHTFHNYSSPPLTSSPPVVVDQLPPINATLIPQNHTPHSRPPLDRRLSHERAPEDARLISLLNSRTSLS